MKMINDNYKEREMYDSYWKERELRKKMNVKGKSE